MNKKLVFGIIGVVAIGGGITALLLSKKKKEEKEAEQIRTAQEKARAKKELEEKTRESQADSSSTKDVVRVDTKKTPVRNAEQDVINTLGDIKGKVLYPASKSSDPYKGHPYALGYTNMRTSAEVNNDTGWTDFSDNFIGKITSPTKIGTITGESYDNLNPKHRWFKVKMSKPCCGTFSDYTTAWVRADTVTFNRNMSSFDGDEVPIEKYDTSNQLGASVFPHSNWDICIGENGQEIDCF